VPQNAFAKIRKLQEQARAFYEEKGIERGEEMRQSWWFRFAHFWLLVCKSFSRNRCPSRASALAYTTLLALIPMLAVVISVTTSILKSQGEKPIRVFINKLVHQIAPYTNPGASPESSEAQALGAAKREEAVKKIHEFVQNTQTGTLGVTGTIALLAVAIAMLRRIEATFNDIWGVTRGRSWYTQVMLYWAVLTLGPSLLIVATALTGGPYFTFTNKLLVSMPVFGNLVYKFLPVLVLSLMFAMFYLLIPNTKVKPQAALVGGLVAGVLWNLNNVLGAHFVARVTSNNAIYGSLGMVPVFMIGLYFGWLILLFGGQVAYAFQNRRVYLQEKQAESVNQRGREFIALRLMTEMARCFRRGEKPPSAVELGNALGIPTRLASQLLQVLLHHKLVLETGGKETGYVPARPLEQITAHNILRALRAGVGQELETRDDPARAAVQEGFQQIYDAEKTAGESLTLAKLANAALASPGAQEEGA
jgi:membrane protein